LRHRYVISHRLPADVENREELAQRISGGSRQLVDKCAAAHDPPRSLPGDAEYKRNSNAKPQRLPATDRACEIHAGNLGRAQCAV
jgi:hypothetical protein